jgi:hypothetical protein
MSDPARPPADAEVVAILRTEHQSLRDEMRRGFGEVTRRQDITNGRVGALELWRARIEGARTLGVGLWQVLATSASLVAAVTAVVVALTR